MDSFAVPPSKLSISVLNSNVCTTYRMDFCEEFPEFDPEQRSKIQPHKSSNRLPKLLSHYSSFLSSKLAESRTAIFCLQEIRSYNQCVFLDFFNKIGYSLILFPCYPGVLTEAISIGDSEQTSGPEGQTRRARKRFSFINGIAVPTGFKLDRVLCYYLKENPLEFSEEGLWGPCGSRVCGGVELSVPGGGQLRVFTTQFGMDKTERVRSAGLLSSLLVDRFPVILTGDFNSFTFRDREKAAPEETDEVAILEKAFARVPINEGTFVGIRPVEKEEYCVDLTTGECRACLDHIFFTGTGLLRGAFGRFEPRTLEERLFPISDHCMIWADFELEFNN